MGKDDLKKRTEQFSLSVMNLVENLPQGKSMSVISNQILRSATSVGANYRAARRAKSKRDFINKLKIVEEEADETLYWLGLIQRSGKINPEKLRGLVNEATELLAIFVASIKTAKLDTGGKGGSTNDEVQTTKYKRKWKGQSSKDEQWPANPKLCTSTFVPRASRCTALNVRSQVDDRSNHNLVSGNLISGNSANGITVFATFTDLNLITRNRIGTDITGMPLGNGMDGIRISHGPKYNLIGGTPEMANIIAFNGKNGVAVESHLSDYNRISCNSIYKNGNLGIDLCPEGITLNQPDNNGTGPNDNQNYPVILSKTMISPGQYYITGYLDSPSQTNQFLVEIYIADFNAAGIAQGKTYLGTFHPVTNGYWSDTLSFSATDSIIATATKPFTYPGNSPWLYGNTSEFTPMIRNNASVETIPADHSFIYPNPAHAGESIRIAGSPNKKYSMTIIDQVGSVIQALGKYGNEGFELTKGMFKPGVYYCILKSDSPPLICKLIILDSL